MSAAMPGDDEYDPYWAARWQIDDIKVDENDSLQTRLAYAQVLATLAVADAITEAAQS